MTLTIAKAIETITNKEQEAKSELDVLAYLYYIHEKINQYKQKRFFMSFIIGCVLMVIGYPIMLLTPLSIIGACIVFPALMLVIYGLIGNMVNFYQKKFGMQKSYAEDILVMAQLPSEVEIIGTMQGARIEAKSQAAKFERKAYAKAKRHEKLSVLIFSKPAIVYIAVLIWLFVGIGMIIAGADSMINHDKRMAQAIEVEAVYTELDVKGTKKKPDYIYKYEYICGGKTYSGHDRFSAEQSIKKGDTKTLYLDPEDPENKITDYSMMMPMGICFVVLSCAATALVTVSSVKRFKPKKSDGDLS